MLSVDDTILYGYHGVCSVKGIQDEQVGQVTRSYYVLEPIFEKSLKILLPVDSDDVRDKIRSILSPEEVREVIDLMPSQGTLWIENDTERKERYRQILSDRDRLAVVSVIKALYERQVKLKSEGRKLSVTDDRLLRDAEKTLYDEFSYVLGMDKDQVLPFIINSIKDQAQV